MKYHAAFLALLLFIALPSCSQMGALAVEDDENAFACVQGKTNPIPGIGASGVMVDVGKTDTTNYTAQDWVDLAEVCS